MTDWQPIETAPARKEIIVSCEYGICTAIREGEDWWYLQSGGHQPTTLHEDSYTHPAAHPLDAAAFSPDRSRNGQDREYGLGSRGREIAPKRR